MTEMIIDTVIRSKRRLPNWMTSSDASKNEKLGNLVELCSISENQTENQGVVSMIKSLSSEAEKKKNSENKEIFPMKYLKKNTSKQKNRDGSKDSTCSYSGAKRKSEGEIVERGKSIDTQHMKLRSAKNNSVKALSQGMREDEAELTVEDLISIAEEFLSSHTGMQNEQSAARESESDSTPMVSPESSIAHRRKLIGEIGSCQALSKCTQTLCSDHRNNLAQNKPEGFAAPSANKMMQSGDAAQDMLELFLGPLLKKVPMKETEAEMTGDLLASTYESDGLVRSFVDVEEQAPLMKKKSSLKDKVAMFF